MAVEQNAVREGTRWDLRGRIVIVQEVTDRSVIYLDDQDFGVKVEKLDGFLARATDPVRAEHARLVDGLRFGQRELPPGDTGKLLAMLRDTALYLLERMPPTCPPYVEPAPPAPAPVVKPAPELTAVAEPIEDVAVAAPACADVDEGPAEYERIARDFANSDGKLRWLKRRTGWQA